MLIIIGVIVFYALFFLYILNWRNSLNQDNKSQDIISEIVSNDIPCDIEEVFENLDKNNFDCSMHYRLVC